MRQTFPSITAETPEVVFASDASMTVLALNHAAMREAVRSWPKLQPKPLAKPMDQQVEELREAAKADPVLGRMFPSLGV